MRNYQTEFAPTTPKPPPRPPRPAPQDGLQLARELRTRIENVLTSGFWFCRDCDRHCERIEGEQGQPAHCERCGSCRITWNPPVLFNLDSLDQVEDV